MMRRFAQFLLVGMLIVMAWVGTEAPARGQVESQIIKSVAFDQADVRDVLKKIFTDRNQSYSVSPEVQGTVTLSLKNVSLHVALENILRQVAATYRFEAGVYQIVARQPDSERGQMFFAQEGVRNHFDFNGVDVREALRQVFNEYNHPYSMAPEVQGRVTLAVNNTRYERILRLLLDQVSATYRIESGVYEIVPKFQDGGFRDSIASPQAPVPAAPVRPMTMTQDGTYLYIVRGTSMYKVRKSDLVVVKTGSLNKVDVHDALDQLFGSAGVSYKLDPNVHGIVTLPGNVSFESALQGTLRQVHATYRIQAGVYEIVPVEVSRRLQKTN
ncbi:MAG: hypothetical protein P4L46_10845 [Fimbriimonas sp.]|nr:hypothetical protein [Fimbriimonas sp.]